MVTLEQKKHLANRFEENFRSHESVMLIDTSNIDNKLMNSIKSQLIDEFGGQFLHGKKRSFAKRCDSLENFPNAEKFSKLIKGNIVLYFHNSSCSKIVKKVESFEKPGSAKYGQIALVDHTLMPQATRLSPEYTKYFQKNKIPTKLTRGCIEITHEYQILTKGKVVTQAQIEVLQSLNILPYTYKPVVMSVFSKNQTVDPEIYRIPCDLLSQSLTANISSMLALGHGTSFPVAPVVTAETNNLLSEITALALELSDKIQVPQELKAKIDLLKNPDELAKLAASAAPAACSKDDKAAAAATAAEPEESSDASSVDMDF